MSEPVVVGGPVEPKLLEYVVGAEVLKVPGEGGK